MVAFSWGEGEGKAQPQSGSWGQLGWQMLGPGTLCISQTWHQAPIPLLPWALRLVASLLGLWRGPRQGCSLGRVPGAGLLCP